MQYEDRPLRPFQLPFLLLEGPTLSRGVIGMGLTNPRPCYNHSYILEMINHKLQLCYCKVKDLNKFIDVHPTILRAYLFLLHYFLRPIQWYTIV